MPFTDDPLTAGSVMVWEDVAANFRHARTWLNAIPVGDFSDGVIQREHLVRPSIIGFPVQGTTGTNTPESSCTLARRAATLHRVALPAAGHPPAAPD